MFNGRVSFEVEVVGEILFVAGEDLAMGIDHCGEDFLFVDAGSVVCLEVLAVIFLFEFLKSNLAILS